MTTLVFLMSTVLVYFTTELMLYFVFVGKTKETKSSRRWRVFQAATTAIGHWSSWFFLC